MNNIIECKLESTYKEIFTGLWQYDCGQKTVNYWWGLS